MGCGEPVTIRDHLKVWEFEVPFWYLKDGQG